MTPDTWSFYNAPNLRIHKHVRDGCLDLRDKRCSNERRSVFQIEIGCVAVLDEGLRMKSVGCHLLFRRSGIRRQKITHAYQCFIARNQFNLARLNLRDPASDFVDVCALNLCRDVICQTRDQTLR